MPNHLRPLCVWGLLLTILAVSTLPAQRPRKEEEDDPPAKKAEKKPEKKDKKEEVDERPAPSKVLDVDDDGKAPPAPRPTAVDLARAARDAQHPVVKALFERLAVPADEVLYQATLGAGPGGVKAPPAKIRVQPVPAYAPDRKSLKAALTLKQLDSEGNPHGEELKLEPGRIHQIRYHEQIAVEAVQTFAEKPLIDLPRLNQLVAADQALSAVARWHQSARERGIRPGEGWEPLQAQLRAALALVLVAQLDTLAESKAWDQAFEVTKRLAEVAPRPSDDEYNKAYTKVVEGLTRVMEQALADPNFSQERLREMRERLRRLEEQFPGAGTPLAKGLQRQAELLLKRAQELVKADKKAEALDLLRQAEETWPDTPGLRTFRAGIDRTYQVLRVGVAELPKYLSPGWAVTDSERRCLDLIFEPLVSMVPDDEGRLYYRPALAEEPPAVVALGRRFKLPVDAKWSDGRKVLSQDVRATVRWMQEGKMAGRLAVWGDRLEGVKVGGNAHRLDLTMKDGFLDPLSLMSFKVLPSHYKPDAKAFTEKPVGSGPFVSVGLVAGAKGESYWQFKENPFYGGRAGRGGLPRAREVLMYTKADPVKALSQGDIDIAFDLTAEQAGKMREKGMQVVLPAKGAVNRRIYFLAVNHRRPALQDARIRRALCLAIDREALLDDHFRKGIKEKLHRSINGPYPAGSWACDPTLHSRKSKDILDPFDPALAKPGWNEVAAKFGGAVSLTLKYPTGDKVTEEAMKDLCARVSALLPGLTLTAEGVNPHKLRDDVEFDANYDLAYYHYDFPEGAFWLYPLLGFGEKGTENFLGYTGPLLAQVQAAVGVRYFPDVQRHARKIHGDMLHKEMPFVPLWQLDPLYAVRPNGIDHPPFDPWQPFARVGEWRAKR